MTINPGNADHCTSCGQIRALLDLHDLTGQCPACFDRNAKKKHPGDHHPIVHALMSASYAAFDLGYYAKSDGFADEAANVRGDLRCNPRAFSDYSHRKVYHTTRTMSCCGCGCLFHSHEPHHYADNGYWHTECLFGPNAKGERR